MRDEPLRRTVAVLLGYALLAWLALLFGGVLRRLLLLPELFETLLQWGVALGAPVAALIGWHYPSIGHGDGGPGLDGGAASGEVEGGAGGDEASRPGL